MGIRSPAVIKITVIDTPSLGNRSYLASDGRVALAVDPPRDIDLVLAAAADLGVMITHVFETHVHNDYLTGGLALARQAGARYCVNAADRVTFERMKISGGDMLEIGEMVVRVLATPGHTFTHLSYVLVNAENAATAGVFTGGSLLCGSTGRPDLLGPEHTRALACAQHASARTLVSCVPESATLYPTHGFGSFCAATPAHGTSSTIGDELRGNPALLLGQEQFVSTILAALDAYPAYYAHMAPANAAGPAAADLTGPPGASAGQVRKRIAAGEWVVDLRDRRAFAAGHVPGTFGVELSDTFATYLGWLMPWESPLTLLADSADGAAAAQRQLARIGITVTSAVVGPPGDLLDGRPPAAYPVSDFAGLARTWRRDPIAVLDVRRQTEWEAGHLAGAVHIPLHDLSGRAAELPDRPLWVHCQAGYRAAIAASVLQAAGREVVAIDDDFARAAKAGLTLTRGCR
jgi:hydroxyacylglutathione hydrolase